MKTKRFLSLLLALVMSFALAAPAFAAEPDDGGDPNEGIMPLNTIYWGGDITQASGTYRSDNFTSTPGNGKYIKVWYANRSDYKVTVYLCLKDTNEIVASKPIPANTYKGVAFWHPGSDTEPVSYYVRIVQSSNYSLNGYLSVAQTLTNTDD